MGWSKYVRAAGLAAGLAGLVSALTVGPATAVSAAGMYPVGMTPATAIHPAGASPAGVDPTTPARAAGVGTPPLPAAERGRTVTLITGDKVTIDRTGRGVHTRPAAGREKIRFFVRRTDSQLLVTPVDAVPLVAAGRLDERLFDVTGLLADGFDDGHRGSVPLIVTGTPGPAARSTTPGMTITGQLPSVDGVAARVDKADAATFWAALAGGTTGKARAPAGTTPNASPTAGPGADRSASAGGSKIWLDGLRKPLLDRSVPQIGAPAAWQAGLTGKGVAVAVLDTGVAADHPDLADRVAQARSFVDDQIGDQVGHGTHVASTIAGTGAASDGRYRGVAPDASLLIGKVCRAEGCPESAILAGMEWAAQQRARVVNLSLGGPDFSGTDPLEEAIDRLTEQAGTLFVVAAGNRSQCSQEDRVGSPATADAALAVGAVDRDDSMAYFSCAGPRLGDGAVKPDITAPGVGIVAARAKGTPSGDGSPVGDWYTTLSGTSMASPHVAGAAALLAQAHPDWTAGQLKAQLMASARPNPASTAYQQGAGRVDVARALAQTVTTNPPSVSLPNQPWPHADDTPVAAPITYRNAGAEPLTLALSVTGLGPDGTPAPDGMFGLDADSVTVPAGGTASVKVTANTSVDGPDGGYTARIVARSGGDTVLNTPVGVQREVESYNLTMRHIDRNGGTPGIATGYVVRDSDERYVVRYNTTRGTVTMRLPRGAYSVVTMILTGDDETTGDTALMGTPKIDLGRDVEITFDSQKAKPIDVRPPRASARLAEGLAAIDVSGPSVAASVGLYVYDGFQRMFTGHVGEAGDPKRFRAKVMGDWQRPDANGKYTSSPYVYHLSYFNLGRVFDGLRRRPSHSQLAAVHSFYNGPADRVLTTSSTAVPTGEYVNFLYLQREYRLPARITEYFQTEGVDWYSAAERDRVVDGEPVFEALQMADERHFEAGRRYTERWWSGVIGPTLPQPGWTAYQNLGFMRVTVPMFGDGTPRHYGDGQADTARSTLYRDGVKVAETKNPGQVAARVPTTAASYRMDTEVTQSVFDTSTRMSGSWTFASPGAIATMVYLPVMAVRFDPAVDTNLRAPGGRSIRFPVTVQQMVTDWANPDLPGAEIAELTVDASFDDGATWQPIRLTGQGKRWTATIKNPATGFVSLRAKAVDVDGNSVEQTIIRAYGLR